MSASKKVLIINTSASQFTGGPTGVWLEETAAPYYALKAAGHAVEMANPAGGPSPIDQGSLGEGFFTDAAKKFLHDPEAIGMFHHQKKLADVEPTVTEYDAIYLAGGHGTCADFVDNAALKSCIEKMYNAGKIVAADCHGPIALAQCVKPNGEALVKGLAVTCFSDTEEAAVGLTEKVPFLVEAKFKEQGGVYEKADDWHPMAVAAGNLITGQNPQSSEACVALVIAQLA